MSLKTFKAEDAAYDKFKSICAREKIGVGDKLNEFITQYNQEHGDGNPVFTLDHYTDVNFLATPAFHRTLSAWESYLTKCDNKEYKQWVSQLENLLNLEHKVTSQR